MVTTTKTRPLKPVKEDKSNNFSFQEYILNTLTQIQNNIKDLRNEVQDLRSETKTEIKDLRTETKTEIKDLRTETKTEIKDLRTNITRVDGKIDSLQRWVVMAAITLFLGLLGMMTYLHNNTDQRIDKLEIKIDKNTKAIQNMDKKLDRLIDRLSAK